MKKVLVLYYSQTGQLKRILDRVMDTLQEDSEVRVDYCRYEPEQAFPFPWNAKAFFGAMPDCVLENPVPMKPLVLPKDQDYDLIILGYQVWFLSPSIPLNSLLGMPEVAGLLKDKPVVTVSGGRNMWIMAQESVKKKLHGLQAQLVGNIALVDHSPNLVSVVTIVYWLFHGKTDKLLGVFPKPGVQEEDIENASSFGDPIHKALQQGNYEPLQRELVERGAVLVKPNILSMESKAKRVFGIWAKLIQGAGKQSSVLRAILLKIFEFYLYFVILFISPLISIFSTFGRIFGKDAVRRKIKYFSGVKMQ
ncbi:dialkylresorcinol condensing enzyme DarA [bacterium SCSIO 12741]|nr:dialkylresorcinol condensing enzyme DarA [bacterium SCSIO 12741]